MAAIESEVSAELTLTTRERARCKCGEIATRRHTYLLPDATNNPKSAAYCKSGVYAADAQVFTCDACPGGAATAPEGFVPNMIAQWPMFESAFYKVTTRRIDFGALPEQVRAVLLAVEA